MTDKKPKFIRVNERIRVPQVRVVDVDGKQLGIMRIQDAQRLARQKGLDLVEVAPFAQPPVCRIIDFGKFKYQQEKREKETRKQHKTLKEIKLGRMQFSPIGDHDLNFKAKHAEGFLLDGHKVRVFLRFGGRWMVHQDEVRQVMEKFAQRLSHVAVPEMKPTFQGHQIIMVLAPKREAVEAHQRQRAAARRMAVQAEPAMAADPPAADPPPAEPVTPSQASSPDETSKEQGAAA